MNLFRTKSIEQLQKAAADSGLVKSLGALDLILLGIGCVIGTGIFVMTGVAAAEYAGPAIILFAGTLYVLSLLLAPAGGVLPKLIRQRHLAH